MPDFATARRMMVDGQLRTFDITDKDVLAAVLAVPREMFVSASSAAIAYLDTEVPVGRGGTRHLLQPMIFAKMLQVAEIAPTSHVLDVGCATGYSSAILSRLSASVVALEENADMASEARRNLAGIGVGDVSVVNGPLVEGYAPAAPYDRIFINGRCEEAPAKLLSQLKENGRLVAIVGVGPAPKVVIYQHVQGTISSQPAFDASGPVLPGFVRPLEFQF